MCGQALDLLLPSPRARGMLDAVWLPAPEAAASRSAELGQTIATLQKSWRDRAGRPRRDSSAAALIAALPACPVLEGPHSRGFR